MLNSFEGGGDRLEDTLSVRLDGHDSNISRRAAMRRHPDARPSALER
jgi:hypothetical protein